MAYIVVEGCIGVGKTSLARLLSDELDARLVLEVVEENPFLPKFYEDPERFGFNVQTFFLLSRYKQLRELSQGALFFDHTVSDYLFDKDFLFASLNLRGDERDMEADYLRRLGAAYDRHFEHAPYPVQVIEASEVDFVERAEDRAAVLRRVLDRALAA